MRSERLAVRRLLGSAGPLLAAGLLSVLAITATSRNNLVLAVASNAGLCVLAILLAGLGKPRIDFFSPLLWFTVGFALLFVVRPLFDLIVGSADEQYGVRVSDYGRAVFLAGFGFGFFLLGWVLTPTRVNWNKSRWQMPESTFRRPMLILTGLVGILFLVFVLSAGAALVLAAFSGGRNAAAGTVYANSSGYLYTAPLWIVPVAVYLLIVENAPRRRRALGLALLIFSQLTTLGVGDRSYFVPAILSVWIGRHLVRGSRPKLIAVVGLSILVFIFGITVPRLYRNTGASSISFGAATVQTVGDLGGSLTDFIGNDDTAMARNLSILIASVPERLDYAAGTTYLGAFARPIPRQIYPGTKPLTADQELNRELFPTYDARNIGFSFSFFGEPYYNFGIFGLVAIPFLFGLAWRRVYMWYSAVAPSGFAATVYACSLPFTLIYLRGGLGVDFQRQAFVVAPTLLVFYLTTRRASPDISVRT